MWLIYYKDLMTAFGSGGSVPTHSRIVSFIPCVDYCWRCCLVGFTPDSFGGLEREGRNVWSKFKAQKLDSFL